MRLEINGPSAREVNVMLRAIEEAYTIDIDLKNGKTLRGYVVLCPDACYGTLEITPVGAFKTETLKFEDIETLKVNIG